MLLEKNSKTVTVRQQDIPKLCAINSTICFGSIKVRKGLAHFLSVKSRTFVLQRLLYTYTPSDYLSKINRA